MVQCIRTTRFSVEGILEWPNTYSSRLLSRSATCELVNVKILNGAMRTKPLSAPSLTRLHSNSLKPTPSNWTTDQTRPNWGSKGRKNYFLRLGLPFISGSGWPPPITPPPPHYLKVWIRQCQWQVPPDAVSSQVHKEFNYLKRSIYFFSFSLFGIFILVWQRCMTLCDCLSVVV